ncbi:MAG TPA: phosphoglucosamine mutase [Flavobacteriales bacterium]|nr:phosphoglucosamine mutase [Flavobacteriales bacterium]HHZ96366.1 phosphoglucosamine mutase [Flavobacteriales bacterium]HIB76206.1 phosphoglucosamine mutase [Flavobacteriales bacterium]HIO60169.1 phosphoglucosamine mutase [Flavobacteriales bacterium]
MLIKSISGIRGTIGGEAGNGLTPPDVVRFATGYGLWVLSQSNKSNQLKPCVVIGRDARISGPIVSGLVAATLNSLGIDVVDLGLSTTPTVELAVPELKAQGGIILTASHNPKQWNALKLLDCNGEFLSAAEGEKMLELSDSNANYAEVDVLGVTTEDSSWIDWHVQHVLDLELVDADAIRGAGLRVAVDAVNSSGGIAIPLLLEALGVEVVKVHCDPTGDFAHNPEPLPQHLTDLMNVVVDNKCDLGVSVDPDVDRLCFVSENGEFFGEEYTLVAVADYVLSKTPGNTVSNLSSTRALSDVTVKHGGKYTASAVGEVNVVEAIRSTSAIIGGEGNGGIIYPTSHAGRDALVGVGLFLTHLVESKMKCSELRNTYPSYVIQKDKLDLPEFGVEEALKKLVSNHPEAQVNTIDGVKFDLDEGWVHLRRSNTEPIIRVYAESDSPEASKSLADRFKAELQSLLD